MTANDSNVFLSVHAEGPATDGGHLPLAELARIVTGLQVTLERLALALTGTLVSRGRRPRDVVEAVRLDLAGFRSGSAIIDIVRPPQSDSAPEPDDTLLSDSLNALEDGIARIRSGGRLPVYFTSQVITGLRELAGGINPSNLTRISFGRSDGHQFVMDAVFREQLRKLSARAPEVSATIVGRIQMGDFSPAALRCRIDTFAGSVPADFDAELQPDGTTVRVLHISALESLPIARISPLATLQRQQGVAEVHDIDELRGRVEDTDDFGPFLDAIRSARHGDQ